MPADTEPTSNSNISVDIRRRGLMFVLSSPSGAGKTTIARRLLERDPNLSMSVSVTTRPRRPGEVHGRDYFFIDPTDFNLMVNRRELLEYAKVFGNYYGTPKAAVEAALAAGKDVLFDIDWQGTQQLRESARTDLVSVFILPPSAHELERRLTTRAQDSMEEIARRMEKANDEMSHWSEYDYVVINRDLDESASAVHEVLKSERRKRERSIGLLEFVRALQAGGPFIEPAPKSAASISRTAMDIHADLLRRIAALENALKVASPDRPGLGHNRPPGPIEDEGWTIAHENEIRDALTVLKTKGPYPKHFLKSAHDSLDKINTSKGRIFSYLSKKGENFLSASLEAAANTVGLSVGAATLLLIGSLLADVARLASEWLAALKMSLS